MNAAAFLLLAVLPSVDCYSRQQYVSTYSYIQSIYAAPVYYSAGQNLIEDAFVEKLAQRIALRAQELQQQPVKQYKSPIQSPVQAPLSSPIQAPLKGSMNAPPVVGSVLATKCARCHSGDKPKAGITIDGRTEMFSNQVTASIRAIHENRMPEDGPNLTGAEKNQAIAELLAVESRLPPQIESVPELRPRQDIGNDLPRPNNGELQ